MRYSPALPCRPNRSRSMPETGPAGISGYTAKQEDTMAAYDAIIIGTGQAGPALARRIAGLGMQVAVVERGRFGGTCVNTGCTPTKTLVASAYAAQLARRGAEYGFSVNGDVRVDMKRVKARKDEISGRSNR